MKRRAKIGWSIFALLVLACLLIGLSTRSDAQRAHRFFDRTVELVTGDDPRTRCWKRGDGDDRNAAAFIGERRCYDYLPPRSYQGIYVDEFEGQRFVPDDWPAGDQYRSPSIWVDFDERSDVSAAPLLAKQMTAAADGRNRIWRMTFIGRETARPGHYGHMGVSRQAVLIDRIVSANLIRVYDGYLPEDLDPRTLNSDNPR